MKHLACHQWAHRFWFRLWSAVQWSERLHPEVYPLLQWLRLTTQNRQHKNTLASYSTKKKANILGKLNRTANIKTINSNYALSVCVCVCVCVCFVHTIMSFSISSYSFSRFSSRSSSATLDSWWRCFHSEKYSSSKSLYARTRVLNPSPANS